MDKPATWNAFLRVYRVYLAISVFLLVPLYFFGGAFFGSGIGGTLEIIRDEIAYFRHLTWLIFVVPPLLFLGELFLRWRRSIERIPVWSGLAGSLALLVGAAILFARFEDPPWAGDYLRGAYRTEDGRILVINSSPVAALDFWLSDGTRAMTWTGDQLSFSGTTCIGTGDLSDDFFMETNSPQAQQINVRMRNEEWQRAIRLPLKETPVKFVSYGTELSGLLVEPNISGPVPLLIFPERPTAVSSLENEYEHHLLAGLGFAVFIYDVRGVGESDGRRSDERDRALGDALAAVEAAKKQMGSKASRVGVYGSGLAMATAAEANLDFAVIVAPLDLDGVTISRIMEQQLYIIPGADKEAPARPLIAELRSYQAGGRPIDIAVYPGTQFAIIRAEMRNGESCQAGKAKSYYRALADWIRTGIVPAEPDLIRLQR